MNNQITSKYTVKNFIPLIVIASAILLFTITKQVMHGVNWIDAMNDFMGSFFIIFGIFKIINLRGFVEAYAMYDIISQRIPFYGYLYPFLELTLGIAYLTRSHLMMANWATVILMCISSIGVAQELLRKRVITCACLGAVFKLPMTYVTLAEDILMGLMALAMIIQYYT